MTNKGIAQVWTFESSSGNSTYETLQYEDGTTSCNCRGWTIKRGDKPRSCKHTRAVDQGIADDQCVAHKDYRGLQTGSKKSSKKPQQAKKSEPLVNKPTTTRRIQWQ